MNINRANTISMKMLDYEHGALNRLVKVITASLHYLAHESTAGNAPPLTKLFDSYIPYWGNPPIANITIVERDNFIQELSRLSVIRVISVLDHYVTSLLAELAAINSIKEICPVIIEKPAASDDEDKPPRLIKIVKNTGINIGENQLILLDFINTLRNCCAHKAGRASKKLIELISNDSVSKAVNIKSNKGKKVWAATFPQLQIGDIIALNPVHAIWASSICLKISREVDKFIIEQIKLSGVLCLAIYNMSKIYYLGNNNHTFDTTQAAINFILSQMRVTGIKEASTVRALKDEMIWEKALERFNKLEKK